MTATLIPLVLGVLVGGATMYYICRSTSPSADISDHLISNTEAVTLLQQHRTNTNDSISGQLPLEVLMTYISHTKSLCDDISVELSGFEFYFAKYGIRRDERESNKMTFFLYPTTKNDKNEHIPFDPIASAAGPLVTFAEVVQDGRAGANFVALNRSNMSPPRGRTM